MKLFKFKKEKEVLESFNEFLYSDSEKEEVDRFIKQLYASYDLVYKEKEFNDIRLDINIIYPDTNHPYYKLVTNGLGPKGKCELIMYLDASWDIQNDIWPIKYLKLLGRLPVKYNIVLEDEYIVYNPKTVSDKDLYHGFVFLQKRRLDGPITLYLQSNREVSFYQVIPLYKEELDYINNHSVEAFLDLLENKEDFMVVKKGRKVYIAQNNSI